MNRFNNNYARFSLTLLIIFFATNSVTSEVEKIKQISETVEMLPECLIKSGSSLLVKDMSLSMMMKCGFIGVSYSF
jgi:hypothetical protein